MRPYLVVIGLAASFIFAVTLSRSMQNFFWVIVRPQLTIDTPLQAVLANLPVNLCYYIPLVVIGIMASSVLYRDEARAVWTWVISVCSGLTGFTAVRPLIILYSGSIGFMGVVSQGVWDYGILPALSGGLAG